MAISGSCLCGGIRFEIDEAAGPFEICHCNRCRKTTGAAGVPAVGVRTKHFRFLAGHELVKTYAAPILYQPPAYHSIFCSNCGSPVPPPNPEGDWMEIAAGLFDDDPMIEPDKHIFVEFVPAWDTITDGLPQYTIRDLIRERQGRELPKDFQLRTHYDSDAGG
jgi:hypothetical protein